MFGTLLSHTIICLNILCLFVTHWAPQLVGLEALYTRGVSMNLTLGYAGVVPTQGSSGLTPLLADALSEVLQVPQWLRPNSPHPVYGAV